MWAPWRIGYIKKEKPSGCVFCAKRDAGDDAPHHILWRGDHCYVILNAYPYNNGHLMIVPYRHAPLLDGLQTDELHELIDLTRGSERVLRTAFHCDGLNIGMNLGSAGGAGIADHLHMHVVPRWGGDTNFTTSVGGLRVIPQSLDDAYRELLPAFERLLER